MQSKVIFQCFRHYFILLVFKSIFTLTCSAPQQLALSFVSEDREILHLLITMQDVSGYTVDGHYLGDNLDIVSSLFRILSILMTDNCIVYYS